VTDNVKLHPLNLLRAVFFGDDFLKDNLLSKQDVLVTNIIRANVYEMW